MTQAITSDTPRRIFESVACLPETNHRTLSQLTIAECHWPRDRTVR